MVNEEKRKKFMEVAEGRIQNVIHSLEIIIPMGKNNNNYDYTEEDVDMMINAIKETTDALERALRQRFITRTSDKKAFSFNCQKENDNLNRKE